MCIFKGKIREYESRKGLRLKAGQRKFLVKRSLATSRTLSVNDLWGVTESKFCPFKQNAYIREGQLTDEIHSWQDRSSI